MPATPHAPRTIPALLLVSILFVSGCDLLGEDDSRTKPIGTFEAIVRGTVTESDGTPAMGVSVIARGYFDACADRPPDAEEGFDYLEGGARTTESGTYEMNLVDVTPHTVRCLNIRVDRTGFVDGEPREADTTVARTADLRPPQDGDLDVLTLDVELE